MNEPTDQNSSAKPAVALAYESLPPGDRMERSVGLLPAIAINMTQICGIGPFVTIPLIVATMGGPQAMFGWIIGALLAMADGMVWAELGAAMPGAGGTYLYLREAFQYSTGKLMPFLFIWTAIIAIPLLMSTGVIGMVQYLGYYFPNMTIMKQRCISVGIVGVVVIALYRRTAAVGKLTEVLWGVMLLSVGAVIVASFTHFDPKLAFTFPAGAFRWHGSFFTGLGAGLVIALYDYAGYNTTAYMGSEMRDPGRVIPRSILYSIVGMMIIYLIMNIGVMGVLPWEEVAKAKSVGSELLEYTWGKHTAQVFTAFIIITAFASVLTGLLGGSRVPYNAAKDRLFLPIFARLHPRLHFPTVALLVMGVVTAIGSLFDLTDVINLLTGVTVLLAAVAQIAALVILRRRQPTLDRPYKMWAYPIPAMIALAGWLYVFWASGKQPIEWNSKFIHLKSNVLVLSLAWIALGVAAFLIWAAAEKTWPFGPKKIHEEFFQAQQTSTA